MLDIGSRGQRGEVQGIDYVYCINWVVYFYFSVRFQEGCDVVLWFMNSSLSLYFYGKNYDVKQNIFKIIIIIIIKIYLFLLGVFFIFLVSLFVLEIVYGSQEYRIYIY